MFIIILIGNAKPKDLREESVGSVREYTGMGQPVGHPGIEPRLCGTPGAYDLGFLGAPPPLPTPVCWQHRVGEAAQVLVAP